MANWTFPDIVERCKASVHLTANQHLAYYDPLERYIDDGANRDCKPDELEIDAEQRERILKSWGDLRTPVLS